MRILISGYVIRETQFPLHHVIFLLIVLTLVFVGNISLKKPSSI